MVGEFLEEVETDIGTVLVAIRELRGFTNLVRIYARNPLLTDVVVLESVMNVFAQGPPRSLSTDCIAAYTRAFILGTQLFNILMRVNFLRPPDGAATVLDGTPNVTATSEFEKSAFDFGVIDNNNAIEDYRMLDTPEEIALAISYVIQFMEAPGRTFEKWANAVIAGFDAEGMSAYFDIAWIGRIPFGGASRWDALAVAAVPIVARVGATYINGFEELRAGYAALDASTTLVQDVQNAFDQVTAACNAPTEVPSSAPTLGPNGINQILGVVAVADVTSASADEIQASWNAFRGRWPNRFFCLLQPTGFDSGDLKVPVNFVLEGTDKKVYRNIRIDNGNSYFQSNWFDLCNLYQFEGTDVTIFPVYFGVAEAQIRASLSFFVQQVTSRGGSVIEAPAVGGNGNWIDPLFREFAAT
eukprot:Sro1129_g244410.1 n/a (414) ;mRNA; r:28055-29296